MVEIHAIEGHGDGHSTRRLGAAPPVYGVADERGAMLPVVEREVPLRVTRRVQHLELPIVAQPDSLPAREADVHLPRLARVRRRIGIEADVVLLLKEVVAAGIDT